VGLTRLGRRKAGTCAVDMHEVWEVHDRESLGHTYELMPYTGIYDDPSVKGTQEQERNYDKATTEKYGMR